MINNRTAMRDDLLRYRSSAMLEAGYREVDERIRQQRRVGCWIVVPSISFVLLFDILPLL